MSLYLRDYKDLYSELLVRTEARKVIFLESLLYLEDNKTFTEDQKKGIDLCVKKIAKMIDEDLADMEQYERELEAKHSKGATK